MNQREQKQLECYYAVMAGLQKRIRETEKTLRGIRDRLRTHPGVPLRIGVHITGQAQHHDFGTYAELSADVLGASFVRVLSAKLAELRKELRELPPVKAVVEDNAAHA